MREGDGVCLRFCRSISFKLNRSTRRLSCISIQIKLLSRMLAQRLGKRCEGSSMGAITLDLRPGRGLGAFRLGMPICEVFGYVEQHRSIYEVVHVKYYDEEPLMFDIVISFPDHGFHLRFESLSQRLRLIEVYDVQRLQMQYAASLIGGPSILPTFIAVYALFGPTFPGTYDADRGIYVLLYPGLSFAFPIPVQYTECCKDREELPLEFPDGTTPVTSRVCIYDSSSGCGTGMEVKKAVPPQLPIGSLYMEQVHVKLGDELWFTAGGQHLSFGASPQDVWTELGRPCAIHKKQVDQMIIHYSADPQPGTTLCGDYFYNYFARGLDILFDGQTHTVKKFVLHTNFPGHADFNSYIKCNFLIQCPNFIFDAVRGKHSEENSHKNCITPETKFHEVKGFLGDGGRPAIQKQASPNNPFGATSVFGYPNITLEVMKNGHIATVTLFKT